MKGILSVGALLLVLGALALGGRLWSEAPNAPPAPRTFFWPASCFRDCYLLLCS